MSFDLSEYVDVAERIRQFNDKYPEGSLQGDGYFVRDPDQQIIGYHYVARAYRTAEDIRPGIGTAYEPIPGKTQFTRDSEIQNAETAAWGRAIVALGFHTKKIASQQEVQARENGGNYSPPPAVQERIEAQASSSVPTPDGYDGSPESVPIPMGKHKGKQLGEVPRAYIEWLAGDGFDPKTKDTRLLKNAARTILGYDDQVEAVHAGVADDDIPF